jgi:hypothetical protein
MHGAKYYKECSIEDLEEAIARLQCENTKLRDQVEEARKIIGEIGSFNNFDLFKEACLFLENFNKTRI